MNTLFIDTRDNKKIIVRFEKDRKIYKKEAVRSPDKAQVALPLIEKIIKRASCKKSRKKSFLPETLTFKNKNAGTNKGYILCPVLCK